MAALFWSVAAVPFWSELDGVVAWSEVEGVVADVLLLLLFWLEDCVALGWVAELPLELLPLPVCAARHRLARRRGEASHSFFIPKNLQIGFLHNNSSNRWQFSLAERAPNDARADGYQSYCTSG